MDTKWDIEKFIGENDFRLWKVNIQVVLIQQKCAKVLKGEVVLSATMLQENKTDMVDKVKSVIMLCLKFKLFSKKVAKVKVVSVMSFPKVL